MQKEINNNFLARSKWKNKYFSFDLWKNIILLKQNFHKKVFKNSKWYKASTIPRCFSNTSVMIHKGNSFKKMNISRYIIGYKFGEFSFTRKPFFFPKKDTKKSKKR